MFFFIRGAENLKKFKGGGKLFCAKMPANDSFMPLGAWWMVWVVGGAGRGLHRLPKGWVPPLRGWGRGYSFSICSWVRPVTNVLVSIAGVC